MIASGSLNDASTFAKTTKKRRSGGHDICLCCSSPEWSGRQLRQLFFYRLVMQLKGGRFGDSRVCGKLMRPGDSRNDNESPRVPQQDMRDRALFALIRSGATVSVSASRLALDTICPSSSNRFRNFVPRAPNKSLAHTSFRSSSSLALDHSILFLYSLSPSLSVSFCVARNSLGLVFACHSPECLCVVVLMLRTL